MYLKESILKVHLKGRRGDGGEKLRGRLKFTVTEQKGGNPEILTKFSRVPTLRFC